MNLIVCEDPSSVARAASFWVENNLDSMRPEKSAQTIFVPAGQTPVSLYQLWEQEKPSYLNSVSLLQVDDVLTGSKRGLFKSFFAEHLPSYQKQIRFIDRGDEAADLAILGLGLNGHVAFHEPGLSPSLYSACVRLNEETCRNLELEDVTWGITYGAQAFLASRAILFIALGESKREIVRRVMNIDPQLPASLLVSHPRVTLIADRLAAGF